MPTSRLGTFRVQTSESRLYGRGASRRHTCELKINSRLWGDAAGEWTRGKYLHLLATRPAGGARVGKGYTAGFRPTAKHDLPLYRDSEGVRPGLYDPRVSGAPG